MEFVATFRGKSALEHIKAVATALTFLVQGAITEPGAVRCEMYQQQDDPTVFLFFSIWKSEADLTQFAKSELHDEYDKMLPAGAWVIRPQRTVLQRL